MENFFFCAVEVENRTQSNKIKTYTELYIMELKFIYSFYKNTITNSKPIMSFYPLTKLQVSI